ncbi:SKI family transcriptional corepressor 1 [Microcaecilia unicolor]|uniref:SKI family transcriptional corepressor 1 n=1 Tax=Microcaecilia unicolor TaxID=1415580 RepID=A0A6P7WYW2_9AMPH|nr:SKI family transcriptional corepressor 1 [Microcaecilia unicolor]
MDAIAGQLGSARDTSSSPTSKQELQPYSGSHSLKPNQVGEASLYGVPIVSLVIDGQERLCLAQISNTLLKNYSYNEIHNRRVALGITCVQCTPVQLEILRRAGAMPISSRRCGMITKREAERLCKSFLGEHKPPKLPENFAFDVVHECAWGSRGSFIPARYNSSRAKCIKCSYCSLYFSPNKFIFHSHRTPDSKYTQPDAANFNSWRRHLKLSDRGASDDLSHSWEDVKAMFNGGTRKRTFSLQQHQHQQHQGPSAPKGPDQPPKSLRADQPDSPGSPSAAAAAAAAASLAVRSYPLIPVPSKGFGLLQKLPPPLFPHPYGFPAFGLCPKKDEGGGGGGSGGGGAGLPEPGKALPGMFWPAGAPKDTVYPSFPVFWPAAAGGGLPVGPYPGAQAQPKAGAGPGELEAERSGGCSPAEGQQGAEGGERCPSAEERSGDEGVASAGATGGRRKVSYISAFRPVVKDAESIAKLYGSRDPPAPPPPPPPAAPDPYRAAHGYLSPDLLSDSSDTADEPDVDVESNRFPEEEESHEEPEPPVPESAPSSQPSPSSSAEGYEVYVQESEGRIQLLKTPSMAHQGPASTYPCNPEATEAEEMRSAAEELDTRKSYIEQRNHISQSSPINPDRGEDGLRVDVTGAQLLEKDFENMAKDDLQKLLVEQMDLRKKLEREFQSLKDNFQDQMKRELAYREEMVQQLQIVRDTLCNELDQERKARYAIQQKLKDADSKALHRELLLQNPSPAPVIQLWTLRRAWEGTETCKDWGGSHHL